MRLCLRTDLYVGVPVYFWPWVFWQLLQLDLWVEQTGRSLLGAVCKRTGEVFITFAADNPEDVKPWRESDLQALLPKALSRALSSSDCPGLDPGPPSELPLLWPEIPGRAALARDERRLFEFVFGLPPPVLDLKQKPAKCTAWACPSAAKSAGKTQSCSPQKKTAPLGAAF